MRYSATATMAASAFAIGLWMDPAVSLPLGGEVTSPQTAIQHVQQQDKGTRQEPRARGGGDRDRDRERGYRERGGRDRDRDGRRSGRGGFDLEIGPGYFGYGPRQGPGCSSLRRRALETDSPYWWRRYRACRGD